MITKNDVGYGLDNDLIHIVRNPWMKQGLVAEIGNWVFFFDYMHSDDYNDPSCYIDDFGRDNLIDKLFEALDAMKDQAETKDEYEYYDAILHEKMKEGSDGLLY